MSKRTDRRIKLWWSGDTRDNHLVLVLWIDVEGQKSFCARTITRLPLLDVNEFVIGMIHARRRLLAQLRMGWRKAVLPPDYPARRRARYVARMEEAELRAEQERLTGLVPGSAYERLHREHEYFRSQC